MRFTDFPMNIRKMKISIDIDYMLKKMSNDVAKMEGTMKEICETDTGNDFIKTDGKSVETVVLLFVRSILSSESSSYKKVYC